MAMATEQGYGGLSLVKKDGTHSQRFPLVEKRYLFGRAEYCDIRINLLSVSREHAEIVVDDENKVWVNAMSKTSDTTVDRKRVDGKILLKDNDLIEIGQRQFIFHSLFPDAPGSAKGKGMDGKGKTPLKESNTPVLKPAPVRPTRPAGFTNEPTREITRAAISAALGGIKAAVAATIDENVAPSDTSDTPKASRGVVKPTPKVAVPPVSASINTPKPPLSISRPTAASAAKSAAKADSTPRAAASSSKAAMADAATPAASCTKGTPNSAGAKTAKRSSLGGKTPTVTMTCRCEALDMLEEYGESIERSFQDGNVSLNASQDKSSEVDSSQFSAAANSSGEGNQFGSPAAVGVPQATTLVFSATKLLPDLTGTSVLAARSPKLRTPPHTSGKVKGVLKTPNSVNKRRSVCFVDHRNETAYLASASNDPDFIPGIIRVKTPQPKFGAEDKIPAIEAEMEVVDAPINGKKVKAKAAPSPAKRVEAGKRGQRESVSPAGQNPHGSKRRRVEPSTYAGVTISRKIGKDGSSASYVQLADDAPGIEDIEAYFLDAANRMFGDLMAGTMHTPDKYFAAGKWAAHPAGNFPKVASGKKASGSAGAAPEAEWAQQVAQTLTGTATPTKQDKVIVQEHVEQAAGFLFKSPKPSTEQVEVISACFENAAAALTDSAQKLPGSKVAKGVKQMFTSSSLPKQPWQEMLQTMHASSTPKGKGKVNAEDENAMYANDIWQATAPPSGGKRASRRSSTGSIKGKVAASAEEDAAPKSRRASTSSVQAKTPFKDVEEGDFDAAAVYAETAPKTDRKATRRSSGVKATTPAKDAAMDEFDADAAFAEVAPKTDRKATRRSSTGAKDAMESVVETPKSRRSSAASATPGKAVQEEDFDANAAFAQVAPKTAERKVRQSFAGKIPTKVAEEDDFDANAAFAEVAPKTGEKVTQRSSSVDKRLTKEAEEDDFDANAAFAEVAPKSRRNSAVSTQAKTPAKDAKMADDFDANAAFAEVAPKTGERVTRRSSTGAKATTPAKQVEEEDFDADSAFAEVAPKSRRNSAVSAKAKTPAKDAKMEVDFDATAAFAEVAPKTGEKVTRRSSTGAKATTPAKQVEEEDFDADSAFAEVAPKSRRNSAVSAKAKTPAKVAEMEVDFDATAAFAEVAPKTSEKVTRRSSTGAKATTPAKQVEESDFDADASFAEVAPKSRRNSEVSVKAKTPAKDAEMEVDFDANAAFVEVAPKTSEKVTRRSSTGAKMTPAKQVEEDDFDAHAVYAAVAPATEHKGARRSSTGSVKAKTPAKDAEIEDDFDADAVYAQVAPATTQKSGRRSLLAKTPAKDLPAEAKAVAQQKIMSYRSAVKARTPAKDAEDFDANAVYAAVAPKTSGKAGEKSRRSSVLAKQIEAEMDAEASDEEFDANEVYAQVAPKSSQKGRRASSSKTQTPSAFSQEEAAGSGSKRRRSPSPAAKSPSPKRVSPKGKSPAKETDVVEFDAAEVYASVAPQTPKRSRWSLSGLVSGMVSSMVSVGRRMSGGLVSQPPPPAAPESTSPKVASPKGISSPPTKEAPVAAPVEVEEAKPEGRSGRRSIQPAAAAMPAGSEVQEEEVKKPARRGRKSVIPEIPAQEEPLLAKDEGMVEEPVAPPPRRGRKSIVPAVVEEKAKKASGKRKSVMPEPVEEEKEAEEADAPRPKRVRKSVAAGGKSPHVTIGQARMRFITPRKENDWRMGCESEEEEEEEAPKKGSRAKKTPAPKAKTVATEEVKEEVVETAKAAVVDYEAMSRAELVALAKERGIKANGKTADLIKGLQEFDSPASQEPEAPARKVKGTAAAVSALEPEPAPVEAEPVKVAPKASRGKKAAAAKEAEPVVEPEPQVEVGKKGKKAAAVKEPEPVVESEPQVEVSKKTSRSRKSVAPAALPEVVEEAVQEPKKTSRSSKLVVTAPVEPVEEIEVEAPRPSSRSRKSVAPAPVEEVEEPPKKPSRSRKSVAPAVVEEIEVEEKKPSRASKSTAEKKAAPTSTKTAKVTAEKAEAPARRTTRRG